MKIFVIYVTGLWIVCTLVRIRENQYFLLLNLKGKLLRLYIKYGDIQVKQHSKVKYLGWLLDENRCVHFCLWLDKLKHVPYEVIISCKRHWEWVYPFSVMGWVSHSQCVLQLMMALYLKNV